MCWFWKGDASQKEGQIAHIDRNSANASEENLAYLCFNHHNQYDSVSKQALQITVQEVQHARTELLNRFKGSPEPLATLVVKLRKKFDNFSEEDEKRILVFLKQYCRNEIELVARARGSVLLSIKVAVEDALRLTEALDAGKLKGAGVLDAWVSELSENVAMAVKEDSSPSLIARRERPQRIEHSTFTPQGMIHLRNSTDWAARPLATAPRKKLRATGAPAAVNVPGEFLPPGATVAGEFEAKPQPAVARRSGPAPALDFEADCAPDECAVVIVRHPSGALTFHASVERVATRRSAKAASGRVRFVIPQRPSPVEPDGQPARRGILSKVINFAVVKIKEAVVDKVVSAASGVAIKGLEWGWWKVRGMDEGWCHVTPEALRAGRLPEIKPGDLPGTRRALLLIHGTFSHAASAFKGLASGDFFPQARALYGDRIFAFNHFTLSRSPEENVAALLKTLPASGVELDVVTHSRGGLVLRQIVERADLFGASARRFRLGHAVLVASPNAGTPWVTPGRWEDTVGLVGNILEAFPVDNPWTDGAAFVANGLTWIAGHLAADWPGLASMDGRGDGIAKLQEPPGPAAEAYSALVANSHPTGNLLARLVDAGVDSFFASANDLVVPSEGGWRVDGAHGLAIPAERVGCFGPGGNLTASSGDLVQHINFFSQSETTDFLLRALRREPQSLGALELERALPTRKLFRGTPSSASVAKTPRQETDSPSATPVLARAASEAEAAAFGKDLDDEDKASNRFKDEFHLLILHGSQGARETQILATYRNARVLEPFATRDFRETPATATAAEAKSPRRKPAAGEPSPGAMSPADASAGTRFKQIIKLDRDIHNCMAGDPNAPLPSQEQLEQLGEALFQALFPGNIRRIYDVARSEPREGLLSVVLTCTVPWLAALPWEFALDPSRRKFLATEEIHFIRNVLTAVPAHHASLCSRMRLLVVAASPNDVPELSEEEEAEKIRHGFKALIDAGLADVDVLTDATPAALHERMETRHYDVVHFIGHGDFDKEAHKGVLLFETADGGRHRADTRTLREILCGRGVQLIFLNACESGRDDHGTRNRGVAQALMEGGLPAIVANQYPVLDTSAVAFAEHFYWSLAHGASLGEAARESRIAVNYSREEVMIDWAVPVLLARDPDFRLCERVARQLVHAGRRRRAELAALPAPSPSAPAPPDRSAPARAAAASGTARLAQTPVRRRVAIADLPRAFPELAGTLNRLNAAQTAFEFVRVEITTPHCAWTVGPETGRAAEASGSAAFLADDLKDASSLAAKLKRPIDAVSKYICGRLRELTRQGLAKWEKQAEVLADLRQMLVEDFNAILAGPSIWDKDRFAEVKIRKEARKLLKHSPKGEEAARLNKMLLEDAYPLEFLRNQYLYADRFAEQLGDKPRELGVEILACITHRPMVCDIPGGLLYNVYGWWPDAAAPAAGHEALMLFSTFGFSIPPRGPVAERVLANGLVSSLAGYLLNTDAHKRGPKNCPLYFNPERDFEHVAGPLHFDAKCRKLLAKKLSRELAAFDKMLAVFQPGGAR